MKFNPDSVLRSALRLGEICRKLKDNSDPDLFLLLKVESRILLRRSFAFWWSLRPWRKS